MSYSVTTLTNDLEAVLHGTTTNKVTNLYGLYNRAARQLLLDVDPQETMRIVPFTNPIFNQVYDYAVPSDLKGNRIIDIQRQVQRTPADDFAQTYFQNFDAYKTWSQNPAFTIQFNTSAKTIRINAPELIQGTTMNAAEGYNTNGTWTGNGAVSNIATDNLYFAAGNGSVRFDVDASGSAYVEDTIISPVDLSQYENLGTVFYWVYLPTGASFSAVAIRWGSSATAYYSRSATTQFDGTAFINGWNLLSVNWDGAAQTGSPDVSNMDYNRITFTYTGAMNNVRVNSIVFRLGTIFNCVYYSKYLFRDAVTGAFQETATANSNLINLDTESYNLFFHLVALFAVQQLYDAGAGFDITFFQNQYQETLRRYRNMYPSQVIPPQMPYYRRTDRSYSSYLPTRF